jgi:hypothetical protein
MSNKTISINPSLFSLGAKTKKAREKKPKFAAPLISPNVLKNKLLKRIKEHKQRETANLDNNKSIPDVSLNYSDEFSDSLNYLQTLSKQKTDKQILSKRKEELERKTLKNHNSYQHPEINIDLPEETIQPLINILPNNSPPYGILKGGTKPTYRDWTRTQRNNNVVTSPEINKEKLDRESRLQKLREKLKFKQLEEELLMVDNNTADNTANNTVQNTPDNTGDNTSQNAPEDDIIAIKKTTTRTIKKKYTLGKSKIKKTVAILIKDRGTRKNILSAQKELKKKPMDDIKIYLREHNLIKIGSNAPNDVIRKMYESSMLSGEISNSNADILLHNFSKSDKEL